MGVEACPFCAVERWALVLALSQFGHFDHLSLSQSASFGRWIKGAPVTI
ncbi:MAG: DUF929 family protein [Chloroflexi bacterium]|nr:DUF929 family protein [Chloroflexota bacterium]